MQESCAEQSCRTVIQDSHTEQAYRIVVVTQSCRIIKLRESYDSNINDLCTGTVLQDSHV